MRFDLRAEIAGMDAAGWHYDDAVVLAMPGMRHIHTCDPAMNVIEVSRRVVVA
jgi:hypothetical protein